MKGVDMDRLIFLGTGRAHAMNCYNACLALHNGQECLLVDGGGGNGILSALKQAQIKFGQIHHLFISHAHIDHLFGVIWVIRLIAFEILSNRYEGVLNLYCNEDVLKSIQIISQVTLRESMLDLFGTRIVFNSVTDNEKRRILDYTVLFFDIHSQNALQYGVKIRLPDGQIVTFLGDEHYDEKCLCHAVAADWLICDALCLEAEKEIHHPHAIHHSTVKDSCLLAQRVKARNLILWHSEDDQIELRKARYIAEGRQYFTGIIHVPDDLDVIDLS